MSLPLPPAEIRLNSPRERDDDTYLQSARQLATAINELLRIDRFSTHATRLGPWKDLLVLDFGFGTARLLAGLEQIDLLPRRYIGLDVQQHLVDWAAEMLGPTGFCEFARVGMHNARYNPDGATERGPIIPERFTDVDLVVARSVFTHMTTADLVVSLREFRRVLAENGRVYATVYVQNGVPAWTDNPGNPSAPSLLKVELNKSYFEYLVEDNGFRVAMFHESIENQGAYLLRPA